MEQAPEGFVARKAKGGDLGGAKGGENELGKLVLRIFWIVINIDVEYILMLNNYIFYKIILRSCKMF